MLQPLENPHLALKVDPAVGRWLIFLALKKKHEAAKEKGCLPFCGSVACVCRADNGEGLAASQWNIC
jgi:hypothetical protein